MKKKKNFSGGYLDTAWFPWLLSAFVLAAHFFLAAVPGVDRLEFIVQDHFMKQRKLAANPNIAIIEIAEDSLKDIGRWPWPRHYHAAIVHLLNEWKAKAIVFDVIFSEPSSAYEDTAFDEALQKVPNVYLPVVLENEKNGGKQVWTHPLPGFEQHAKGTGHINVTSDKDGVVRRIKPLLSYGNESHPHLAVRVAEDILKENNKQFTIPLDAQGNFLINWAGPWATTFKHYSFSDLLKSDEAIHKGDVPVIQAHELEGKICLIGVTATGHVDIKPNPLETAYPQLGVHANVINSILSQRFLKTETRRTKYLVLVIVALLSSLCFVPFQNIMSLGAAILLGIAWTVIARFVFVEKGILLDVVQPILLIASLFIVSALYAITVSKRKQLFYLESMIRDAVTGLYEMRHFRNVLNRAIPTARPHRALSVIVISIDHFKEIQKKHGTAAGEMVLKAASRAVHAHTRYLRSPEETDCVARFGAEEIIVMVRNLDEREAVYNVAERLRKSVEALQLQWKGVAIPLTASLGVTIINSADKDAEGMIRRAENALRKARKEGKNIIRTLS